MTDPSDDASARLRLSVIEATERLSDAIAVRGFEPTGHSQTTWRGVIRADEKDGVAAETVVLDVRVPPDYPFVAPRVVPLTRAAAEQWAGRVFPDYREASWAWHREPDGALCLFESADHSRLPWVDPDMLFDQVRAWLRQDAAGWPDDPPALDLERYLQPSGELILYDDLAPVKGLVVSLSKLRSARAWRVGRPLKVRRGSRGTKAPWPRDCALVLDVGELAEPIRDWQSLLVAASTHRQRLEREVDAGVRHLLLMYTRRGEAGVLALQVTRTSAGWTVTANQAAGADVATMRRRAHRNRDDLAGAAVTVVGVGAIGSVLADLLHRSGVGHLHLVDPELLLPGNVVRHLAGVEHVGKPKVAAVAAVLRQARPDPAQTITCSQDTVTSLDKAVTLLRDCDVLVDASADSTASRLIAAAAREGAGRAVSVCVLADGYAIRADHWPEPPTGGLPAPMLPPPVPGAYETGCSSPVSTTPPAAAWEAAALGARHAIDALLAARVTRPEERVLRPDEAAQ